SLDSQDVGLPASLDGEVTELWSGRPVPTRKIREQSDAARGVAPGSTALEVVIPRHGAVLLAVRWERTAGVVSRAPPEAAHGSRDGGPQLVPPALRSRGRND